MGGEKGSPPYFDVHYNGFRTTLSIDTHVNKTVRKIAHHLLMSVANLGIRVSKCTTFSIITIGLFIKNYFTHTRQYINVQRNIFFLYFTLLILRDFIAVNGSTLIAINSLSFLFKPINFHVFINVSI